MANLAMLATGLLAISCYLIFYPVIGLSGLMLLAFATSVAESSYMWWMLGAAIVFGAIARLLEKLGNWLETKM